MSGVREVEFQDLAGRALTLNLHEQSTSLLHGKAVHVGIRSTPC